MATNPSILAYQQAQRLPVPDLSQVQQMPAQAAPVAPPVNPAANPLLGAPAPTLPSVIQTPDASIGNTQTRLLGDQGELQRLKSTGDGISQIGNPILRGAARVGDVLESILAPGAAAYTPGTAMHHQLLLGQTQRQVNNDLQNQQQQATTGQTEANTNYLNQKPEIEQSKIDQKQTAVQERVGQAAAARGQLVSWDANGLPTFTDDHTSQAFADHQALNAMHQATADKQAALTEIQKNHYIPGTPEYAEVQKKIAQADQRLQIAMGSLGLRAQGLHLRAENTAAANTGIDPDTGQPFAGANAITGDNGQQTTVGSRFAPAAVKNNAGVVTLNDLTGSVAHAGNVLKNIDLSDPNVVAVMSDPTSTVGKVINGKLIQGTLSPEQITAINAVRQLHEQAGILRKTTGGTAAEAQAQRILDTVPVAGDSPAMTASKLGEIQQVIERLTPALSHVAGGVSVHHPSGNPPSGVQVFTEGGTTYHIPANQVADFKRDHPNAR